LLDGALRLRPTELRFAGQITGCEGYVESAAIGLAAAVCGGRTKGEACPPLPPTTALGALINHITGAISRSLTRTTFVSANECQFRAVSANCRQAHARKHAARKRDGPQSRHQPTRGA